MVITGCERLVAMVWTAVVLVGASAGAASSPASSWFALEPVKDDFRPNILDGRRWVEAPTGKHGFVTARGERFVFEDGTAVSFLGAQIGGFGREQIDYATQRMRRQGINITRMHGLFLAAPAVRLPRSIQLQTRLLTDHLLSALQARRPYCPVWCWTGSR